MPQFAIQRGPTPLCTWDLGTGKATFHPRAIERGGILVVAETEKFAFVLSPAVRGQEQRIFVGDVPLSELIPIPGDAGGAVILEQVVWRELPYFESGRGETTLVVQSQPEDSDSDTWETVLKACVYVQPSKFGEDSYQKMADDLQNLSRSLLVDLYGKSKRTHELRFAKEGRICRSREEELESISAVLDRLGILLLAIRQRPASRVKAELARRDYWGNMRLTPAAIGWLSRRGTALCAGKRPIPVVCSRPVESFDVKEHRFLRAFLDILLR